jgi:hypothetical protein
MFVDFSNNDKKKPRGSQEPVSFTNWSYVKTMSCSGSRPGIPINIKNTKFVKDLPMIDFWVPHKSMT